MCDALEQIATASDQRWGSGIPTEQQGMNILGTPLGHPDFVRSHFTKLAADRQILLERIGSCWCARAGWQHEEAERHFSDTQVFGHLEAHSRCAFARWSWSRIGVHELPHQFHDLFQSPALQGSSHAALASPLHHAHLSVWPSTRSLWPPPRSVPAGWGARAARVCAGERAGKNLPRGREQSHDQHSGVSILIWSTSKVPTAGVSRWSRTYFQSFGGPNSHST